MCIIPLGVFSLLFLFLNNIYVYIHRVGKVSLFDTLGWRNIGRRTRRARFYSLEEGGIPSMRIEHLL